MIRINLLKVKHQPMLLGVFGLVIMYGLYFLLKAKAKTQTQTNGLFYWSKIGLVYLNCLTPFLMSLIVAIQRKFEDQRHNFNSVLSLPSRSRWLFTFELETSGIWLLNIVILNIIFATSTSLPYRSFAFLWLSLALFSVVWIPVLALVGIEYGYLASLTVGVMSIPFMIYYGTTELGGTVWRFMPWVYNTKIFLIYPGHFERLLVVLIGITAMEQWLAILCFNRWNG